MKRSLFCLLVLSACAVLLPSTTAAQRPAGAAAPPIPHTLEGRDRCLLCHTAGRMPTATDVPPDHEGRTNQTCQACHEAGQVAEPPAITHPVQGMERCIMCHIRGYLDRVTDMPADHEGRRNSTCGACHETAEG